LRTSTPRIGRESGQFKVVDNLSSQEVAQHGGGMVLALLLPIDDMAPTI